MGTAYAARLKLNDIATGNVIDADDFNAEFNAILNAFAVSGHTHNGDAGEGGAIEKIGPSHQYLTDGDSFYPSATSLDLGKTGNQWDNIYIDGKAYIDGLGEDILVDTAFKIQFRDSDIYINSGADGELDIAADGEIDIVAPIVDIDASTRVDISGDVTIGDDLTMGSDGAIINFGADSDIVLTHVADTGLKLSSVATGNLLHLQSTEAGATAGPVVIIERDSASPADDDFGGSILFKADSDTGVSRNIAKITTQVKDVSNTTEDSEVVFSNIVAGTETTQITFGTGITFGTAITAGSTLTVNAGINVDDFNIDGTTIALSAGDMTLDGAADIVLDATGEQVIFKDGSTNVGHVDMDSDNLTLKSLVANKNIIFKGDDAGSEVTALTLNMAEAGDASFGRNVTIGGNLTVSGTTTQVDSTVTTIADPIITLGANASDDNKDRGIEFKYNDGSARVGFFGYDDSEAKFTLLTAATNSSEVFSGTTGTLVANLEGNVTGDTTGTNIGTLKKTASDTEFTLPASDGSAGQFLKTDASGNLSFGTVTLTTINNNADNRIITGSGTADTLEAEANLTYDGTSLSVTGNITTVTNITASGTIQGAEVAATSDERLKSDIQTIDNALDKVMKMRGVTYIMQAEKGTGVIAQEVEKVLPEVVVDNEYKSVAYGNMVGVLIEAIKDLKKEIDEHKQGCKCHAPSE